MNLTIQIDGPITREGVEYQGPTRIIEPGTIERYRHRITMGMGFDSAQIEFPVRSAELSSWIDSSIGFHVSVYNENLAIVWQGFINQVSVTLGPSEIRLGPLSDIANKVRVAYQGIDWNVNPPIPASREITAYATNDDSIEKYFTSEFIVSGGQGTATEMEAIRDLYLAQHAWPATRQDVALPEGNAPTISLDCLGYAHALDFYYYNNDTASGLVDASQKVVDVIDADPNEFFLGTDGVNTNTFQVPDYEDGMSTARTIIDHILSYGDSENNRYMFGVYEDREVRYEIVPDEVTLGLEVTTRQPVLHPIGNPSIDISPSLVRPGAWVKILDLPGLPEAIQDDLWSNTRQIFIESVDFTAPNELSVTSSKFDVVTAMLARIGLLNELI